MDLLFVYENRIARDAEGNYYTGTAFSQKVFDRYLQLFDHITLLMRAAKISPNDMETLSHMNKLDMQHIDVCILPDMTESLRSFLSIKKWLIYRKTVIQNITPDRAVIMRVPSKSGALAAKYCHKIGKPFLVEVVGCPWDSLWNHSLRGKMLAPGSWNALRETMRFAPYAVYVTSEFLQQRYPTNGKQTAISDVELQTADDAVLAKRLEKIRNQAGKIKIATAGAVNVAYKGQKFVIEALAKLKAQGNTEFEYHMAGGGDNSALKELAERLEVSDQVVFEGSLPHDQMFAWLDNVDLYIQPSLTEGLPRALVEAMSRGLPALGAGTGGIPELLSEECIFQRKSVDAIVRLLSTMTKEQLELMAKDNFEHARAFQKEFLEAKRYDFYANFAVTAKGEIR